MYIFIIPKVGIFDDASPPYFRLFLFKNTWAEAYPHESITLLAPYIL